MGGHDTRAGSVWLRHVPITLLCMAAFAGLFGWSVNHPRPANDELDIIRPAFEYMRGHISTDVKYPSFPYYFHGIFFWLTGTLGDVARATPVARLVNMGVFIVNMLLFHRCALRFLSSRWALLATAGLLASPWIVFSGMLVKTESLQLTSLLGTLLALQQLDAGAAGRRRWVVVAAVAAALCMSTKLNPFPLVLVTCDALWRGLRGQGAYRRSEVALFGVAFAATLLATFTNLWVLPEIIANKWQSDPYFSPGAGPFRAVTGELNLLYGRFGSFFVTTFPASLGLLVLLWPLAAIRATGGPWLHAVFGTATALVLLLGVMLTRMRLPHGFTAYMVYFHLAAFCAVQQLLADAGRRRWLRHGLASLLVCAFALHLQQSWRVTSDFGQGFLQAGVTARRMAGPRTLMVYELLPDDYARTPVPLRQTVDVERPGHIFLLSSYLENMGKYRADPVYRDNYAFYGELLSGATPCRLVERVPVPLPFEFLSPDPELKQHGFYLFECPGRAGSGPVRARAAATAR